MERLLQDVRFAFRVLIRDRAFTTTTLLTLAICIAANAAIFAVVNSVLLRPLPVPEPERLVLLYNSYPKAGVVRASNGVPDYYDRLREMDVFEELSLFRNAGLTVGSQGRAERLPGMIATPSLFRMVRATPIRGRIFTEGEGEVGNQRKVILSYALWQRLFGGRDEALGQTLQVNGNPHAIVGVMPPDFQWLASDTELWLPAAFTAEEKSDDARHSNSWSSVGRLKPGATAEQAQQQLDALNVRSLDRFPPLKQILINAGFHSVVTPLHEDLVHGIRPTLFLLWGGVLFVLAIGAVNITNLVLIRSSARAREVATRHALGAGMGRIARQLLTETVLLTLTGGVLGILLGVWGLSALSTSGLQSLPRGSAITMDTTAVVFTIALCLVVGLLVGLVPVVNLARMNLSQAFREEGRSGTSGRGARVLGRTLVAAQVAFAFMLLAGAGLLLASFQKVVAIDPGFDAEGVLTARVAPPRVRYPDEAARRTFAARFLDGVRALPGVESAGLTTTIPFGGDFDDSVILAEGYHMAPGESLISPFRVEATPGYLETMRVPLKRGRLFNNSDTAASGLVAIVDEVLANKFWPGQDPIGRRMYRPENPDDVLATGPKTRWITVVGVVGETKMAGLVTDDTRIGMYYFPAAQAELGAMTLAVRTTLPAHTIAPSIRGVLASIDPELPLYSVRPMQDRIDESLTDRRTPMTLAAIFAGVALFLAATGLYGVLAYQVSQRRKEIGIRMALGSQPRGIFSLVLREGLVLLAAGFVVGIGGAFAIRKTMETQLYAVGAMDPLVLSTVGALLAMVAFLACTLPARRAAKTDPLAALNE